jgi:HlyD family secretion protein
MYFVLLQHLDGTESMLNRSKMIKIVSILCIIVLIWIIVDYLKNRHAHQELTLYGNVDVRNVALAFRVPGRIAKLRFEEGDHVNKNDVLAMLDTDTFIADQEMASAELSQAMANENNANLILQRRTKLAPNGAVSQASYDDALANLKANQALVLTKKANLLKAKIALSDTQLRAPNNGIILTRVREPGAIVDPTQIVYTLTLDNPVWVRAYIDEPDLGRIYPGQKAEVTTDSNAGKIYYGHIGFISPEAEFTPKNVETTQLRTDLVFRLRVIVDNPDRGLRQGMPVTVKLLTDK